MDGCLDEARPLLVEAAHHLDTDDPGVRRERTANDELSPEHTEVAIGVASRKPEQQLDDVVVDAPDDLAVKAVATTDLVPLNDVDRVVHVVGDLDQQSGLGG